MSEEKRARRTPEQMAAARDEKIAQLQASIQNLEEKKAASIAAFDEKIAAITARIAAIEEQKKAALAPKKPGRKASKKRRTQSMKMQEILKQARKSGMKAEDIASMLGIEIAE